MTLLTENSNNPTWIINMLYSGFVLSVIIFLLFAYTVVVQHLRIKQLKKFKDQNVNVYENKNSKWTLYILELFVVILFIVEIIIFILTLTKKGDIYINDVLTSKGKLGISFDVLFLVDVVMVIIYLGFNNFWANSIIVVSKNNTLVSITDVIDKSFITSIRTDKNRHFYNINYKDKKIKGNLNKMRIRYNYKLKDFLTTEGYLQKESSK